MKVDNRKLTAVANELSRTSSKIADLVTELESLESGLRRQTTFAGHASALRRVCGAMREDRYHVYLLAQALDRVGDLYSRTETAIEQGIDDGKVRRLDVTQVKVMDTTVMRDRLHGVLYGGMSSGSN